MACNQAVQGQGNLTPYVLVFDYSEGGLYNVPKQCKSTKVYILTLFISSTSDLSVETFCKPHKPIKSIQYNYECFNRLNVHIFVLIHVYALI